MANLRILLIGNVGQVGWELKRTLSTLGDVVDIDRPGIELTSADSIRKVIRQNSPQVIVNAAAYTAVDKAEDESELAMGINATAPAIMAEEAKVSGAAFLTYSTDYVFDGAKQGPYTEEDQPNPLSAYGRSKLAGDEAVRDAGGSYIIFRTSWVYGARGKNFLLTMMKLVAEREVVKVVDDQIGAPTWSRSLAEATAQVIAQRANGRANHSSTVAERFADVKGVYNLTSDGRTSWFGFTEAIVNEMRALGRESLARVLPITSAEYPVRAVRPKNSVLDNSKLKNTFGLTMPQWDDALSMVVDELQSLPSVNSSRALAGQS
ncbi:MAG TPA: dTDP-4-dehydrorhamnose reductase [Terriglobales bacterium]|nr:dTDP-4-dehydrorhamnose reductase [Terriglobales bacterium]